MNIKKTIREIKAALNSNIMHNKPGVICETKKHST